MSENSVNNANLPWNNTEIKLSSVKASELVALLPEFLKDVWGFNKTDVTKDLLQKRLANIKGDLQVLIEYPYTDKLYRNTYYNYFATKHTSYPKENIRLVFFEKDFQLDKLMNLELDKKSITLQNSPCLGFISLRPTFPQCIGRSILSPKAFKGNNKYDTCTFQSDILVSGFRFPIEGFPFSSQDNEYYKCAETVIWTCLEYFGNKYQEFRTISPSEIIDILSKYTFERQVPSHGLSAEQISFVFKELNFGVRIYDKSSYTQDGVQGISEFHRILHYYVDSAIPVIGVLRSKSSKTAHAVLYTGYEKPNDPAFDDYATNFKSKFTVRSNEWQDFSGLINKYIICDDNKLLYQRGNFTVNLNANCAYSNYYEPTDNKFNDLELSTFIVPLPSKVYLEASQARDFIIAVLETPEMEIEKKDLVVRTFFTTSRSFKDWITSIESIDSKIKKHLIATSMPKFIWIGELSTIELIKTKGHANGFVIIDATQPNVKNLNDCLFIWHKKFLANHEKSKWKAGKVENIDNSFIMYKNFKEWEKQN